MIFQSAERYLTTDIPVHIHGDSCSHISRKRKRTIMRLQFITVGWMLVECSTALSSAWRAHSPALLAFGSDSFVKLLSALVVLLQFTSFLKISTERAARIAGVLLFILVGIVAITSVAALALRVQPDTSPLGMAVTVIALLTMPMLSRAKRKKAEITGNRALAADAAQSAICAYLVVLTLLGLVLNAILHIRWVDPVAALISFA
jgi:divalent metal cation (Fe/Co/Zn/Cd) transporter